MWEYNVFGGIEMSELETYPDQDAREINAFRQYKAVERWSYFNSQREILGYGLFKDKRSHYLLR